MKKNIMINILLASMVIGTSSVLAAENEPVMVIAPAPVENEMIVGTPQITVNGENVDLSKTNLSQYMFTENGNTMVPLRAIAEKMGYTVDWDNEKRAVTVSDDKWEVVASIGNDSYFGVTKIEGALGMTAPQSYGTAPKLIEGTTFVPAKMFELMGYECSTIGQFADFSKYAEQIPNPFTQYENIDDAQKDLDFIPAIPSYIPEGFVIDDISVMDNNLLQIIYRDKDDNRLSYRMGKGTGDISGDYNTYSINKEVQVNDITVTLRGNDKISGAVWVSDGFSFAVNCDKELDESVIKNLIAKIK